MATKGVSHKSTHEDNSLAHAFIAAAFGLLIFITAAQFIFLRIMWERIEKLVTPQVAPVAQVQESKVIDTDHLGSVSVDDLVLRLPNDYTFSVAGKNIYTITTGGAYAANISARIHRADVTLDHTPVQGTQFMGSEEIGTSYSVETGIKWVADYYYSVDPSPADATLVAFNKVVHGIWWWPGY